MKHLLASLQALLLLLLAAAFQAPTLTESVCYKGLGCFSRHSKGNTKISFSLPDSPSVINTRFLLLTESGSGEVEFGNTTSALAAGWNKSAETKFIIHGYLSRSDDYPMPLMQKLLADRCKCNVFNVDWRGGANLWWYPSAAANTRVVAAEIARLISWLGVASRSHVIGFSLGAQVAGHVGRRLRAGDGGPELPRITGLDPAAPLFSTLEPVARLDPTDAKFVDVIHTNGGVFGTNKPLGHQDFYPNGGERQPGCRNDSCHHSRVTRLFIQSLLQRNAFMAVRCPTFKLFMAGKCGTCSEGDCQPMGYDASASSASPGRYFLLTPASMPFTTRQLKLTVTLSWHSPKIDGILQVQLRQDGDWTSGMKVGGRQLLKGRISGIVAAEEAGIRRLRMRCIECDRVRVDAVTVTDIVTSESTIFCGGDVDSQSFKELRRGCDL